MEPMIRGHTDVSVGSKRQTTGVGWFSKKNSLLDHLDRKNFAKLGSQKRAGKGLLEQNGVLF